MQRRNFVWCNRNWIHPQDQTSSWYGRTTFEGDLMYQWGGYFPNPNWANHMGHIINIFKTPEGQMEHFMYTHSQNWQAPDGKWILRHVWQKYN